MKWDKEDKVVAITNNNAANMIFGVNHFRKLIVNIPCFAHTLYLVIKKSLENIPEIRILCEECQRVIIYFKLNSIARDSKFKIL